MFCNDCADHFMYLTQDKVRFKFRICADCKDDEATPDNIRDNGAMALDSVTQVAKTMGREAKKQRDAGKEVNLPNTSKLMVALGMEDGEELTFARADAPVDTSSALVAQMEDPWDDAWWQVRLSVVLTTLDLPHVGRLLARVLMQNFRCMCVYLCRMMGLRRTSSQPRRE